MPSCFRRFRFVLIVLLLSTQTGCLHWMRAYQTYLQMDSFDRYFSISSQQDFTVHFKEPKLYNEDFVALAKLHASTEQTLADGSLWHYRFNKVDSNNQPLQPAVSFYFDLRFNQETKITDWTFSNLFLQIAPPAFLEASIRSLGGAEINEAKQQLRARADAVEKIADKLPLKPKVIAQLGEPILITQEDKQEIYEYRFKLDANAIESGYEDRAVSEVKLTFDKSSQELIKMAGRFAGLKIAINYRVFQEQTADKQAEFN